MTDKQKRFVEELVKDPELNVTKAYRRVYTSVKNDNVAKSAGNRLLSKVDVKAYKDELLKQITDASIADATEVMQMLTKGARMQIEEEVVIVEGTGDGCSEARVVKKQISAKDAIKCAELLGKRYALFTEKVEANVQQQVVFTDESELED